MIRTKQLFRPQIHVHHGRVRLCTINGYDWSGRYPLIVEEGMRINVTAIMDAEGICTDGKGVPTFEKLHSRRMIIWLLRARLIC